MTPEARAEIMQLTAKPPKLRKGDISLAEANPELAAQLHPTKNGNITAHNLSKSTGRKVMWLGPCGHEWEASVHSRSRGAGCPICANRIVLPGFNDICTTHPQLAAEWDYEANGDLRPEQITAGMATIVVWRCPEGHKYTARMYTRTKNSGPDSNCPVCHLKRCEPGVNDLLTRFPHVAAELHPIKSAHINPAEIISSQEKVWWQCDFGHEWKARISARAKRNGSGCPYCKKQTSYNEQALFFYVQQMYSDAQNRAKVHGVEVDVLVPSLKLAFEYDGQYYHTEARLESDIRKFFHLQKHGYTLIRIREPKCPTITNVPGHVIVMNVYNDAEVERVIQKALIYIQQKNELVLPDINLRNDGVKIATQLLSTTKESSVAARLAHLAAEWHPTKNGKLTPAMVHAGSAKYVWWQCSNGHAYQTSPQNRAKGASCPICQGCQTLSGYNDLETNSPQLLQFWNYELNDVLPSQIYYQSRNIVWWTCQACGTAFQGPVVKQNGLCPDCTKGKFRPGINDLQTAHPELLALWDFEKNDVQPSAIHCNSWKSAHWKCDQGHTYTRRVSHQVRAGCVCKQCAKATRKYLLDYPDLASWWHPTKNHKRLEDVTTGIEGKWWWRCPEGHEFQRGMQAHCKHPRCPICHQAQRQVFAIHIENPADKRVFESAKQAANFLQRSQNGLSSGMSIGHPVNQYLCHYGRFPTEEEYQVAKMQWEQNRRYMRKHHD